MGETPAQCRRDYQTYGDHTKISGLASIGKVLLRQLASVAKNLIKAQPVSNRTVIIGVSKRAAEQPTTHRRQSYRWTKETTYTFAKAAEEFAQAWRVPHHTRIGLPAIDVNKTLAERYIVDAPIHVTLGMVWGAW